MKASLLQPWSYFPLGLRAYRDTFRFTGRARPLEVAEFWVLSMAVTLAFSFWGDFGIRIELASPLESFLATAVATAAVKLVPTLPVFALIARRIQDFGLPGWLFSPLLVYVLVINQWKFLAAITAYRPASSWGSLAFLVPSGPPSAMLQLLGLPIVVAMMIAIFIPGTPGPNRYGPDPRQSPEPEPDLYAIT